MLEKLSNWTEVTEKTSEVGFKFRLPNLSKA